MAEPSDEDFYGPRLTGDLGPEAQIAAVRELANREARVLQDNTLFSSSGGVNVNGSGGFYSIEPVESPRAAAPLDPATGTILRPFTVRRAGLLAVAVTPGQGNFMGTWTDPTWSGGDDFDVAKVVAASTTLSLRVDIAVSGVDVATSALNIGWDIAAPFENLPSRQYEIDFLGETITETAIDGQILIPIAEVTVASGEITDINQIVDYNIHLPWNNDIDTTVTGGGST